MIVYHVTSAHKLKHYLESGRILPPVRAWKTIECAEKFSIQTGRPIILRLKFPRNAVRLEGHRGYALYIEDSYPMEKLFGKTFSFG